MHDMEHASPFTRGQHLDPKAPHKSSLYTGPDTSSQLLALQELEGIATGQHQMALPAVTPEPSAQPPTPSLEHARRSRRKAEESLGFLGIVRKHIRRLTSFSLIGGGVFIAGLALQIALVRYCGLSCRFTSRTAPRASRR
jgi:hypothetical protein